MAAITFTAPAETTSPDPRQAAGMGVERVPQLFTSFSQQEAKKDHASAWVQVDLGADRKRSTTTARTTPWNVVRS